jgi:glycosyltransferase 2 family protein
VRRVGAGRWLQLLFLVAVLVFGGVFVARRWPGVQGALTRLSPPAVAASFVLAALGTVANMVSWWVLFADFGARLPLSGAARVFFVGQLGKYIPGSVWSIVAQAELGRRYRVPRSVSVTVSILGVAIAVFGGVVLGVVLVPVGIPGFALRYWWVALVVPVYVAVLQPRVVRAVIDVAFRIIPHHAAPARGPTYAGLGRAVGWQMVSWLLLGLHAWLLLVGMDVPLLRALPVAVGAFALAYSVGLVAVAVPNGAGVREAVFTVMVGTVTGSVDALAVALVSRVMLAVLDFGLGGAEALTGPRADRRAAGAAAGHDHHDRHDQGGRRDHHGHGAPHGPRDGDGRGARPDVPEDENASGSGSGSRQGRG